MPPLPLLRDEKVIAAPADQDKLTELYTGEAVKFITANKDRPFFLYLPHAAVHVPLHPGPAFKGKSKNGDYGDWVEEADWSVGRVLTTLRELKLNEKTLVIFASDNGGTKNVYNGPLRGTKFTTWEGGVRVPALVRWTGRIPAGSTCDAMLSELDLLPTVVNLAGGKVPTDRKIDGVNIWPVLTGQRKDSPPTRRCIFGGQVAWKPFVPVRGSWPSQDRRTRRSRSRSTPRARCRGFIISTGTWGRRTTWPRNTPTW
jgi:arylsulfatase A-like enzyme